MNRGLTRIGCVFVFVLAYFLGQPGAGLFVIDAMGQAVPGQAEPTHAEPTHAEPTHAEPTRGTDDDTGDRSVDADKRGAAASEVSVTQPDAQGPRLAQDSGPVRDAATVVTEGNTPDDGASRSTVTMRPALVISAGAAGVVLVMLFAGLLATRRRRSRFEIDDAVYARGGEPSHRISALDNLAPNSGAAVLEAQGPVPDRPSWLRCPNVESVRRGVRRWRSESDVSHLVWSDGDGVRERDVRDSLVVGHGVDCDVQVPGLTGAVLCITPCGRRFEVEILSAAIAVECNGVRSGGVLVTGAGDELTIAERVVLEFRVPPIEPAYASRADHRRLEPRDERAFSSLDVGVTSIVLGRDPLPYRGVQSVPTRLVIAQVSNDHAEVWMSGGQLYVRDLGSSNGTMVAGRRIDPGVVTPIARGQTLALSPLVVFTVR